MQRVLNKTTWGKDENYFHVTSKPVSGNYYPLASAAGVIRITDTDCPKNDIPNTSKSVNSSQGMSNISTSNVPAAALDAKTENQQADIATVKSFAVLTDTAHGASALHAGELEVMLGRRCAELTSISVDDTDPVVLVNWIVPAATVSDAVYAHRRLATRMSTPIVAVSVGSSKPGNIYAKSITNILADTNAKADLPDGLFLQSLDSIATETTSNSISANRLLLRLANIYQAGEPQASFEVKVALSDVFATQGFSLTNIIEVPLNGIARQDSNFGGYQIDPDEVLLFRPSQIRTFQVTLQAN
jgi:hypothetical protein